MSKNFSLKFKIADIFVIVFSLLVSCGLMIGIFAKNNSFKSSKRIVEIYQNNVLLSQYKIDLNSLDERMTIVLAKDDYPTLLDDFTIELDPKKGIHVTNITCYDHTCEKQGWINIANAPIVCIPNNVQIRITSASGGDFTIGGIINEKI
jgi:hypothetical protein